MENDIYLYYQNSKPGHVQILGPDFWNGTQSQLASFQAQTGATYPLLLNGSSISTLYGISYDNFLVIDQGGIIRYISPYSYPLGSRYDLNAIRNTIDGLLPTAIGEGHSIQPPASLRVQPNLVRDRAIFHTHRPANMSVKLAITDVTGKILRRLPVAGEDVLWDGRDEKGQPLSRGVYLAVLLVEGRVTGKQRFIVM